MSADILQTEGDPVFWQHFVWLLGHPGAWLTIASVLLCVVGAVKLGRVIKRNFATPWFVAYVVCIVALTGTYLFLVRQWYKALVEGAPYYYEHGALVWFQLGSAVFAVLSLIWIVTDLLRRNGT